jgi:hypothetical protein
MPTLQPSHDHSTSEDGDGSSLERKDTDLPHCTETRTCYAGIGAQPYGFLPHWAETRTCYEGMHADNTGQGQICRFPCTAPQKLHMYACMRASCAHVLTFRQSCAHMPINALMHTGRASTPLPLPPSTQEAASHCPKLGRTRNFRYGFPGDSNTLTRVIFLVFVMSVRVNITQVTGHVLFCVPRDENPLLLTAVRRQNPLIHIVYSLMACAAPKDYKM